MFFYSLYSSSFFLRLFLSCVVLCSVLSIVDDSFSVSATAYCRLLARVPTFMVTDSYACYTRGQLSGLILTNQSAFDSRVL